MFGQYIQAWLPVILGVWGFVSILSLDAVLAFLDRSLLRLLLLDDILEAN
jgi:hypothetical protein